MHLCFVDESGTPAKPGRDKPRFFVIAGVVIPEERWHSISQQLHGLKTREKYHGEIKWRFFSPSNTDEDNPMVKWDAPKRNAFRENIFTIITKEKSVNVIAGVTEAIPAYALAVVNTQQDIYFRTYKVVTERFQYLLQDITRTSGHRTLGIIVADHRGKGDDNRMRIQHQRLVDENAAFTSTYLNLIEGLFLAPSHMSIGIQLADMVAGAIWRFFEAGDAYWYNKVIPAIRKSPGGKIDGFGIARFPKATWKGPIP